MPMARECTFQDFLKCTPYTFSGTEELTRLEEMKERGMLGFSYTATSAGCTMKGYVYDKVWKLKDCPKLRSQNHGNQTRNKTRGNEATTKVYAIDGGGTNPDSNVVTEIEEMEEMEMERMEEMRMEETDEMEIEGMEKMGIMA
nr:hypothetical protein [Tanacetum cinerariifolium]